MDQGSSRRRQIVRSLYCLRISPAGISSNVLRSRKAYSGLGNVRIRDNEIELIAQSMTAMTSSPRPHSDDVSLLRSQLRYSNVKTRVYWDRSGDSADKSSRSILKVKWDLIFNTDQQYGGLVLTINSTHRVWQAKEGFDEKTGWSDYEGNQFPGRRDPWARSSNVDCCGDKTTWAWKKVVLSSPTRTARSPKNQCCWDKDISE